jgi:hypothetical protein
MAKEADRGDSIRVKTGEISGSALAVGKNARASISPKRKDLRAIDSELKRLADVMEAQAWPIENTDDIQAEVFGIREEISKKKPNLALIKSTLKGVLLALGPAQALSDIAAHVLDMVARLG